MISRFVSSSPMSGSVLMARSLDPASDSLSPSLSAPPLLTHCLGSLSKINKIFLKIKKNFWLSNGACSHKWCFWDNDRNHWACPGCHLLRLSRLIVHSRPTVYSGVKRRVYLKNMDEMLEVCHLRLCLNGGQSDHIFGQMSNGWMVKINIGSKLNIIQANLKNLSSIPENDWQCLLIISANTCFRLWIQSNRNSFLKHSYEDCWLQV